MICRADVRPAAGWRLKQSRRKHFATPTANAGTDFRQYLPTEAAGKRSRLLDRVHLVLFPLHPVEAESPRRLSPIHAFLVTSVYHVPSRNDRRTSLCS